MAAGRGAGRTQNDAETRNSMAAPYRQDLGADRQRPEKIRMKPRVKPVLLSVDGETEAVTPLPRAHHAFNEKFLQDLLAAHPNLLPVERLRPDVGDLLCIGCEVSTRGTGAIDNLFLSTGGYVVVAETKLWRNPQARREVVSQVLDYVKEVVNRDFDWLESVWRAYCEKRGVAPSTLLEALGELDDDLDEQDFFDRVHGGLDRGDVLALIVGDGIETRLQELVDHLCRDSAHLRYSIGLVALHCYRFDRDDRLLALPELIQHVEPVERAHVRVDVAEGLKDSVAVSSVVEPESSQKTREHRRMLSSEAFYENLARNLGNDEAERVRSFIDNCVEKGLGARNTTEGIRLTMLEPLEEGGGEVPLLAINQDGTVYNPRGARGRLVGKWGWTEELAEKLSTEYWKRLHEIDDRFGDERDSADAEETVRAPGRCSGPAGRHRTSRFQHGRIDPGGRGFVTMPTAIRRCALKSYTRTLR